MSHMHTLPASSGCGMCGTSNISRHDVSSFLPASRRNPHGPHASADAGLLCRLFTPEIATFYEEFLTSKGITFMKGDTASSLEGKDGKARP